MSEKKKRVSKKLKESQPEEVVIALESTEMLVLDEVVVVEEEVIAEAIESLVITEPEVIISTIKETVQRVFSRGDVVTLKDLQGHFVGLNGKSARILAIKDNAVTVSSNGRRYAVSKVNLEVK
jgi:hypothetical protein